MIIASGRAGWSSTDIPGRGVAPAGSLREVGMRSHRLADDGADGAAPRPSAREHQTKRFLVRLVTTSWESKRLLGVPPDAVACIFQDASVQEVVVLLARVRCRVRVRVRIQT